MSDHRRPAPESTAKPGHLAPASSRQLLDGIVQSSTVELFQSRGVAVAPLPSSAAQAHQPTYFGLAGVVNFTSPKVNGNLSLSLADQVFTLFSPPVLTSPGSRDLLRELTNQLVGRVKNRLMQFQLVLRIGVPSVISGQALDRQRRRSEGEIVYLFRTLRGEVVVIMDVNIEAGSLSYSSNVQVAKEGDFIPF